MPQENRPTLLTWIGRIPTSVWGPISAGILIAIVGLFGVAAGQPWLFPSLGPSAFEYSEQPRQKASRSYNAFIGHMIGLGAGFLAVAIFNAWDAPPVLSSKTLTFSRTFASAVAIALTSLFCTLAYAPHPPAAATTLLVTLGAFQTGRDAWIVFIGVLILSVFGELSRQVRVRGLDSVQSPPS